ncbi:MAG: hypothetical protein Tsb005_06930 [Gammaproteobacteria bacterium]
MSKNHLISNAHRKAVAEFIAFVKMHTHYPLIANIMNDETLKLLYVRMFAHLSTHKKPIFLAIMSADQEICQTYKNTFNTINYAVINEDDILLKLEAYRQAVKTNKNAAFKHWYPVASKMTSILCEYAAKQKFNVFYNTNYSVEKSKNIMQKIKQQGYTINLHTIFAEKETTLVNANNQQQLIRKYQQALSTQWLKMTELAQTATLLYKNNYAPLQAAFHGVYAKIAEKLTTENKLIIYDEQRYQEFTTSGNIDIKAPAGDDLLTPDENLHRSLSENNNASSYQSISLRLRLQLLPLSSSIKTNKFSKQRTIFPFGKILAFDGDNYSSLSNKNSVGDTFSTIPTPYNTLRQPSVLTVPKQQSTATQDNQPTTLPLTLAQTTFVISAMNTVLNSFFSSIYTLFSHRQHNLATNDSALKPAPGIANNHIGIKA